MLIATKTNNVQQQQQQQQQSTKQQQQQLKQTADITLIGSNVINRNNNNKEQLNGDNKATKTTTVVTKSNEFACGRKEDALLPCDSEAKQRHEALAKKWNMKYMHYKNNNNNNNNNHKELDKQQQQNVDNNNAYLNIRVGGANMERARRGRRPNARGGVGNRGRGNYKGNVQESGKELPPNSLYAAAMLTVAKMKAKRGGDNGRVLKNSGCRGGNNNRTRARLYATLIGNTTNSSASCEAKATVAAIGGQSKKNEQNY